MNTTHLRRSLAAVAAAVTCLVVVAGPAAAATHDADITGGVITLYATGTVVKDTYDLAPPVPPCGTSTLELDVTTTGTIGVTDLLSKSVASYPGAIGGNPFLRVLTRYPQGNVYGTLAGTGPYTVTDMRVVVRMDSYGRDHYSGCVPTGDIACSISFMLELDGTLTGTTPTSTATLTGSGVGTVASLGCLTSFGLVGTTAAVTTAITATLTT